MKIIVGLGNPGKEYERTAHNAGFMVVEKILNSKFFPPEADPPSAEILKQIQNSKFQIQNKYKSEVAEGEFGAEKVLLVKPMTFMNRSGEAVAAILNFYKVDLSDLIVVHDDSDLPLGKIKIQKGGGSAGHHGIESIIKAVGEDFVRIRVGVRGEEGKAMDFILRPFNKEQEKILEEVLEKASEAILAILKEGLISAMNKYNA